MKMLHVTRGLCWSFPNTLSNALVLESSGLHKLEILLVGNGDS